MQAICRRYFLLFEETIARFEAAREKILAAKGLAINEKKRHVDYINDKIVYILQTMDGLHSIQKFSNSTMSTNQIESSLNKVYELYNTYLNQIDAALA